MEKIGKMQRIGFAPRRGRNVATASVCYHPRQGFSPAIPALRSSEKRMSVRIAMSLSVLACVCAVSAVSAVGESPPHAPKLMVVRPLAELKAEEEVVARVPLGTLLAPGHAEGNWLWIDSHQGWIRKADVVPTEQAIEHFTAAIEEKPSAETYHQRGIAYDALGRTEEALQDYNEALRHDPKNSAVYNNRGNVWQKKGDVEKAFADYSAAIEHDQQNAAAWNNRSVLQAQRGDLKQALRDVETALRLNPRYAEAYNNRGVTWRQMGDFDKAIADYEEAIRLAPNYAAAYGNRGYAKKQKGEYEQALKDYTVAIHLAPDQPTPHNDLAWLLATCPEEKFRDPQRALEHATKAVQLTGESDWNTLDTLAAAQASAGEFDAAAATIRKAIEIAPAEARDDLEQRQQLYEDRKPFRE